MDFFLYASAGIAALALVLIVIFIFLTYKRTKQSMDTIQQTIGRVESKVNNVTEKANGLLEKTNGIADDANQKIQVFEQFAESAKDLEETTRHLDASFQNIALQVSNPPEKQRKVMEQASVVTETIARIYYGFKKEKKQQQPAYTNHKKGTKILPKPQKKLEYHE